MAEIRLADLAGKLLPCRYTEYGPRPGRDRDSPTPAPNSARNFLALAQVGDYDGLRFDRIVHQEVDAPDGTRSEIRLVRFGCPAGSGDRGIGHLVIASGPSFRTTSTGRVPSASPATRSRVPRRAALHSPRRRFWMVATP